MGFWNAWHARKRPNRDPDNEICLFVGVVAYALIDERYGYIVGTPEGQAIARTANEAKEIARAFGVGQSIHCKIIKCVVLPITDDRQLDATETVKLVNGVK